MNEAWGLCPGPETNIIRKDRGERGKESKCSERYIHAKIVFWIHTSNAIDGGQNAVSMNGVC